jgi:D-serine dehydratase
MTLALATAASPDDMPSVYEVGLRNDTIADGLAVPRASGFVFAMTGGAIDGAVTVSDAQIRTAMRMAWSGAGLRLEPSAAASIAAMHALEGREPAAWHGRAPAIQVCWATGGALLPDKEWKADLEDRAKM